jgi:hypothetical protein
MMSLMAHESFAPTWHRARIGRLWAALIEFARS